MIDKSKQLTSVLRFMNKSLLLLFSFLSFNLVSCDDSINQFDLDEDPLIGKINGEDWSYTVGRADYSLVSNQAAGYIFNEELENPCLKVNTTAAHVLIAFPTAKGNYNLPFINNTGYVKFATPNGGPIYTAAGGFLEIVEVNSYEIIGYISADFDDDNYVQGSFLVEVCN